MGDAFTYVFEMSTQAEVLLLTAVMLLVAGLIGLLYVFSKSKFPGREGESVNPYLAGEPESALSRIDAPSNTLYWGFIRGWAGKVYDYLRSVMHSGRLNDWAAYMSAWIGVASVIALAVTVAYIVWGVTWP